MGTAFLNRLPVHLRWIRAGSIKNSSGMRGGAFASLAVGGFGGFLFINHGRGRRGGWGEMMRHSRGTF